MPTRADAQRLLSALQQGQQEQAVAIAREKFGPQTSVMIQEDPAFAFEALTDRFAGFGISLPTAPAPAEPAPGRAVGTPPQPAAPVGVTQPQPVAQPAQPAATTAMPRTPATAIEAVARRFMQAGTDPATIRAVLPLLLGLGGGAAAARYALPRAFVAARPFLGNILRGALAGGVGEAGFQAPGVIRGETRPAEAGKSVALMTGLGAAAPIPRGLAAVRQLRRGVSPGNLSRFARGSVGKGLIKRGQAAAQLMEDIGRTMRGQFFEQGRAAANLAQQATRRGLRGVEPAVAAEILRRGRPGVRLPASEIVTRVAGVPVPPEAPASLGRGAAMVRRGLAGEEEVLRRGGTLPTLSEMLRQRGTTQVAQEVATPGSPAAQSIAEEIGGIVSELDVLAGRGGAAAPAAPAAARQAGRQVIEEVTETSLTQSPRGVTQKQLRRLRKR